ncbi:penicillin-binding protein 2 [Aminivibrio sp.]|jgi:cell division protein FtsI (penicillin-binding protein 3)/stage V sporulation protein D (sporulation-specific penicillin-binding protein)|uniref:peptidoglycan D,D-transpeptidase FtsI family protein n=1 Tax=Aminivibrio sp. TaxID=1872489 RepID=UPI001A5D1584|nr:penicillin-binding protein 2 [Aminivibrio sp.]MBL3538900.1 penicillin-binding protein 2 [Aminivibrio sp.]
MLKRFGGSPWFLVFLFFAVLFWRVASLQLFPDPRVEKQSRRQYWSRVPVSTNRGFIYDADGNALALSVPSSSFFLDPAFWNPSDGPKLQGILPESIIAAISAQIPGRFFWLARKVDRGTAEKIRSLNLKGIYEISEKKRLYPNKSLLSHVLGFCDVDDKGLAGIELVWDKILFSPPGIKVLAKGSSGRTLDISRQSNEGLSFGPGSVRLTVDSRIQFIVEKRLEEGVAEHGAKWGSIVCIDPETGAIVSMASWPSFDPNVRENLTYLKRITNNSTGRTYEPGSTFKPIVLGIAMEKGCVGGSETFNCPYRIKVADGHISEASNRSYGRLSVPEILIKSSNTGMAQIGMRVKPFDMYNGVREWGFSKPLGIELNGVEDGLLATPEQWRGVVPSNISIGQGLAVTPLHLANAMAAIANGGFLLRPYIVSEVRDSSGRMIYKGERTLVREVLSPKTASWLSSVMKESVKSGTGKTAGLPYVSIAGKTGTAQVAEKGEYKKGKWVSSFAGFWPAEKPDYVMLVVIGEPSKGKYYGGDVAAPVFRRIVEDMFQSGLFADSGWGG